MGLEYRRVPPHWEHPRKDDGKYLPLHDNYNNQCLKDAKEWVDGYMAWIANPDKHRIKLHPRGYSDYGIGYLERMGNPPDPIYYMPPFTPEEATWWMIYNNVEGTPKTPAFSTKEECARWAAEHDSRLTYEDWLQIPVHLGFVSVTTYSY